MKKLFKLFTLLVLSLSLSTAVSGAVITVLNSAASPGTSGNGRAPQGSRLYINTAYYISPSEMTSSGFGADQVTSVGWTWTAATPQNATTTGTLKVYLLNSTDLVYSRGSTYSNVGMTKVIDGTITITNSGVQFSIDVPVGGPGTSTFNTIAGQGVYVAFEYQTTTALALPLGAPTVLCNAAVANSLTTYQSNIANGTLGTLSAFRPETRFGNPLTDYGNVQDVYCLGNAPIPFSNEQSLAAKIKNESATAQTLTVTFDVKRKATGTVLYTNTAAYSFLGSEIKTVTATGWNPSISELDTVIVTVGTLAGETVVSNNTKGYRHLVNTDTYNYSDLSAISGGVGFNTGAGQILNRYHVNGCSQVESVSVNLQGGTAVGNTVRGVVCNASGVQVAVSADHVITAGDANTYYVFTFTTPPQFSNEDFYVGLEQTAAVVGYFPVSTQVESTASRNNAYFSNAAGGGALAGPYTTLGRFMVAATITPLSTTPTVSGPTSICEGDGITLTATFAELNPAAVVNWYEGSCGGTFIGTGTSLSLTPVAGVHNYYVRAEDACNSYTTACGTITVTAGVSDVYFADADGDTYGDGATAVLSCTGAPVGYVLDPSDCDDTNSGVNPGATEICDGLDNNCDGNIDEGMATATITAPGGTSSCKPDPVTLVANTGAGYTYQWFKNGIAITGATGSSYSTNKPAYYQVQVNVPGGCFALSSAVGVVVNPSPNANISAPNGTSLCAVVKLKASYAATYTWQWYKDDAVISGATNYTYTASTPGNYYCAVTNEYGCTRNTGTLTVTACREGDISEANGSFNVYPNPTSSTFTVDLVIADELNSTADVFVMNMVGEVIYSGKADVVNGYINNEINLGNDLADGMYLVKVVVDGNQYNQQIMIAK